MAKLWSGRFRSATDEQMHLFNKSIAFDKRLFNEDIEGSAAHVKMLAQQGIISEDEKDALVRGLKQVQKELKADKIEVSGEDEDIHSLVERRLTDLIGKAGKKLHTARSRNDQVQTDLRLYLKKQVKKQQQLLVTLLNTVVEMAGNYQSTVMPGYTHLQPAQPVTLGFYLLSYFFAFKRDLERLIDTCKRIDQSPLGAGALAGVNYNIDRQA
ncbi:MAG TPA: lyase family protein, partial [Spirochaetota bacterium]|nr:lyase family protein [Spirochaetota bacterium]